jgi:uncharacterized protein (TIGR02452 family)
LGRTPSFRPDEGTRSFFKEIAKSTINAINNGIVDVTYQRQRRHSLQEARPTPFSSSQRNLREQPVQPVKPRQRSLERTPFFRRDEGSRSFFKEIANSTIDAINNGIVDVSSTQRNTQLYLEDAHQLVNWQSKRRTKLSEQPAEINILPMSTLKGARFLYSQHPHRKIGILNFASATKAGGGFRSGARAQEESIARSSTLYVSLITRAAQPFYRLHANDENGGFYTHSMIYSPSVYLLRDDNGDWLSPLKVDVLTSPAVNAGDVRKNNRRNSPAHVEAAISDVMKERMGRILALFERKNARQLVLGSFGTGVFQNDVQAMAELWHDLLRAPGAPFAYSFDHVVFAIPDFTTQQKFARGFDPAMVSGGAPWAL